MSFIMYADEFIEYVTTNILTDIKYKRHKVVGPKYLIKVLNNTKTNIKCDLNEHDSHINGTRKLMFFKLVTWYVNFTRVNKLTREEFMDKFDEYVDMEIEWCDCGAIKERTYCNVM